MQIKGLSLRLSYRNVFFCLPFEILNTQSLHISGPAPVNMWSLRAKMRTIACKALNLNQLTLCIYSYQFLLVVETWSVRYFQDMMYSWSIVDEKGWTLQQIKSKRVIEKAYSCIFFPILFLRPKIAGIIVCVCVLFAINKITVGGRATPPVFLKKTIIVLFFIPWTRLDRT